VREREPEVEGREKDTKRDTKRNRGKQGKETER
jgi:hypothetical protein